jgi:hypothetical protein
MGGDDVETRPPTWQMQASEQVEPGFSNADNEGEADAPNVGRDIEATRAYFVEHPAG